MRLGVAVTALAMVAAGCGAAAATVVAAAATTRPSPWASSRAGPTRPARPTCSRTSSRTTGYTVEIKELSDNAPIYAALVARVTVDVLSFLLAGAHAQVLLGPVRQRPRRHRHLLRGRTLFLAVPDLLGRQVHRGSAQPRRRVRRQGHRHRAGRRSHQADQDNVFPDYGLDERLQARAVLDDRDAHRAEEGDRGEEAHRGDAVEAVLGQPVLPGPATRGPEGRLRRARGPARHRARRASPRTTRRSPR